ncbi:MAG: bifunctional phosphopantothenoylcysteine decarboxylase/phosphopantothenate--cysteine ligase CoaBC [Fidelibacterota bacterium]|nr:MAG: bifunctional phosphopantothenoylcysteine decarboxylase/phosphopantothenate--cysteine ligase CoaBC [Candidatus Neomarinimicrobiota bacterium]
MSNRLKDKRILLGVCGSIAAYKACELVRELRKAEVEVTVAMTESATKFVGPTTFAALTNRPVMVHQFPDDPEAGVRHVGEAESLDAVLVAPATANILGKAAHAVADDLLSTLLNIVDCPVMFVPAMNSRMWHNPATQDAVMRLRSWGRLVLEPDEGPLATLHVGVGRFPETSRIITELRAMLDVPQLYQGKRVLVTAGPTRESLDPVRYLSNRSSGKMGYALAAAARDMGAEVTLISGPVALDPIPGCRLVDVVTTDEMLHAVEEESRGRDILIMAAAVADFRPSSPAEDKIPRTSKPTVVPLEPTPDILKTIRGKYAGTLVGFSLQAGSDLKPARKKLEEKGADFLVVNRYDEPDAGFDAEMNHVWILSPSGEEVELPPDTKSTIARKVLEHIIQYMQ